jgi:putative hydrolase of the HAD superfamily
MIRALIIDIGGVLAHAWDDELVADWEVQFEMTRAQIVNAIYGGNDDQVLIGNMAEDDWWAVVRERLPRPEDAPALRAAVEASQVWNESLVALLREVKGTMRTAILSNAWPSQRTRMEKIGLGDLVDVIVLSCDIGVAKPDVNAFRLTLERLGSDATDTLFIDDTPGHVDAARSLGILGQLHTVAGDTARVFLQFLVHGSV